MSTLRGTSRVTGWQSAEAIATGCEAAWMRTAAVGRGPPYVRGPEFSEVSCLSIILDDTNCSIESASLYSSGHTRR